MKYFAPSVAALVVFTCLISTVSLGQLTSAAWTPDGAPQVASVTNGIWTLSQAGATLGQPLAGYCTNGVLQTNTSTRLMQRYYFPFISGSAQNLEGWFDYRVKDQDELIAHGNSSDGGLTWTIDASKLRLNGSLCPKDASTAIGNDNGQGHPMVLSLATTTGKKTFLYTLDRAASVVDNGGLLVHDLSAGAGSLATDEPVSGDKPVPDGITQTSGLQNPDGIFGQIPGSGTDSNNPVKILYLKKVKGNANAPAAGLDTAKLCTDAQSKPLTGKVANYDRTELRLASSSDGLAFSDPGAVSGLNDPNDNASTNGFRYVGPRGTIVRYGDNIYGMDFSGGGCNDGDADAYHFIGYAHSSDAVHWTVDNGVTNPLVQVDYTYPSSLPTAYFSGRVYAPNLILNADGSAKLIFSGYRTGAPLPKTGSANAIGLPTVTWQTSEPVNYRSILVMNLKC